MDNGRFAIGQGFVYSLVDDLLELEGGRAHALSVELRRSSEAKKTGDLAVARFC